MELMVVLALAAVILGVGVPSFRDFQRNNRLTVAANDVLGMVITSRHEALRRQITVSMCPSADPEAEDAARAAQGSGWIVFDRSGRQLCDATSGEELDLRHASSTPTSTPSANTDCISFATTGFKRVGGRAADHLTHDVLR